MILIAALLLQLACSGSGGDAPAPPASVDTLPRAIVGITYLVDLEFPYGDATSSYRVSAGALPEGFALFGKRIQGSALEPGLFGFEVQVQQANSLEELGRKLFSLTVDPDTLALKIWTRKLVPARSSEPYGQRVNTSGGQTPYRFSIIDGRLPSGLNLDAEKGTIAGMPTSTGVYPLTVEVEDINGVRATSSMYIASLSSVWGKPLVALQLSRSSGPAPLSVFFDATGTRSTKYPDGFHDLHHDWQFDDPESPHPSSTGPVAAHVFDRPGIYLVRLTTTDPDGLTESAVYPITVEDPDVIFAGIKTVCFATTNDFTHAPSGSIHVVTGSFDEASNHIAPGRRLLFRRGDTFQSKKSVVVIGGKPSTLGAFGPGWNPDGRGKFENNPRIHSDGNVPLLIRGSDIRIMDLVFAENPGKESVNAISAQSRTTGCLILRVDTTGYTTPIAILHEVVANLKLPAHKELMLADSVLRSARWNSLQMGGLEFSFVGNTVTRSLAGHNLRMTFAQKAVLDGNTFSYPAGGAHAVQIHSLREPAAKKIYGDATEQIVIRDNDIRGDSAWLMTLGPQDKVSKEVVREILVEKNRFLSDRNVIVQLYVNSADTTIRNNLFLSEAADKGKALLGISITQRGIEPIPSGIKVFHNTFYDPNAEHVSDTFVDIGSYSGKVLVFNNLVYAPLVKDTSTVRGGSFALEAGNLNKVDPRFVNPGKMDFRLEAGSVAIRAGIKSTAVDDYSGYLRDLSNAKGDVGALSSR